MSAKEDYYAALQRLKRNQSHIVSKGSLINKDTVALEAGRKRGSIRANRGMDDLIAAIDIACVGGPRSTTKKEGIIVAKSESWKEEKEELLAEVDMLRSRNMSLLYQVYSLTRKLSDHNIETSNVWDVMGNIEEFPTPKD
jgi:hypothetical protein